MNWIKELSSSEWAIACDTRAFKLLEENEITREECLDRFVKNNNIKSHVSMEDFIAWLVSEGYDVL